MALNAYSKWLKKNKNTESAMSAPNWKPLAEIFGAGK